MYLLASFILNFSNFSLTLFHLVSAILSVARMYFGLPHDILPEVTIDDKEVNKLSKGLDFMKMAANAMERPALVFMAQSYEFGTNGADIDPDQALYW